MLSAAEAKASRKGIAYNIAVVMRAATGSPSTVLRRPSDRSGDGLRLRQVLVDLCDRGGTFTNCPANTLD